MPKKINKKRKKILLADDHQPTRAMFSMILGKQNYQMIHASNGEQAYSKAFSEQPDLILMDVMMPVMDGLEAIRRIREEESLRHVPIIMLTTSVRMKDVPIALASGADAYIAKPQSAEKIIEKVKSCL